MKLNSIQKRLLEKHRNNYRFCYNKTISIINGQDYEEPIYTGNNVKRVSRYQGYSRFDLRNMIVPSEANSRTPWLLESGSNIRSQAVFEAYKSFKTCISNIKNGNINHFDLRFKKKRQQWTMNIDKENIIIHGKRQFSLYSESGQITTTEDIEITKDIKITYDGRNYFILVPQKRQMKKSKADNFSCSLDPGIRKFQTLYSEDHSIKIGDRASSKIYNLLLLLDKCKNKKKALGLRLKIKNLQSELHHKTTRFLCENYMEIVIPRLAKNNDIIKNKKLKSKTVRQMVVLGHSKFLELLKTKAEEYTNVKVHETTEEYTSQICPECSKKTKTACEIYKCNNCKFEIDRDLLGSRNITLKFWDLLKIC